MSGSEPPTQAAGQILGGRYRLIREIGRGGMGRVWQAQQLETGRDVALKILSCAPQDAGDFARRFEREAKVAAALVHPNAVRVYDLGRDPVGVYIVMELLRGSSLARVLRRGIPPLEWSIGVLRQLADALEAAHRIGIVHRDLKPGNVVIESVGAGERAVLIDFGLAFSPHRADMGRLTPGPLALGTPAYMSPEQLAGEYVGTPSDVYGFACLTYELITGSPPFEGTDIEVSQHHMSTPPRRLRTAVPEVSERLHQAMAAALAKSPVARPTMSQLRLALHDAIPAADDEQWGVRRRNRPSDAPTSVSRTPGPTPPRF